VKKILPLGLRSIEFREHSTSIVGTSGIPQLVSCGIFEQRAIRVACFTMDCACTWNICTVKMLGTSIMERYVLYIELFSFLVFSL
jgi:hypothetical protein